MNRRSLHAVLGALAVFLLATTVVSYIYYRADPLFDFTSYVSSFSTFVIACLTLIYVYTSSRQLDVMAGQLREMRHEREFQSQPLPWISSVTPGIEKPRFFYSPPEREHRAQARYTVRFALQNAGSHPAVSVDVSARIAINTDGHTTYLETTSERLDVLGPGKTYPATDNEDSFFMFSGDSRGYFMQALTERDAKRAPVLQMRVLYKNILGGCFVLTSQYQLWPDGAEQETRISNWLAHIRAFPIQHKRQIGELHKVVDSNEQQWEELFAQVKMEFAAAVDGDDLRLFAWPVPGTFHVKAITTQQYDSMTTSIYYGTLLPPDADAPCLNE